MASEVNLEFFERRRQYLHGFYYVVETLDLDVSEPGMFVTAGVGDYEFEAGRICAADLLDEVADIIGAGVCKTVGKASDDESRYRGTFARAESTSARKVEPAPRSVTHHVNIQGCKVVERKVEKVKIVGLRS